MRRIETYFYEASTMQTSRHGFRGARHYPAIMDIMQQTLNKHPSIGGLQLQRPHLMPLSPIYMDHNAFLEVNALSEEDKRTLEDWRREEVVRLKRFGQCAIVHDTDRLTLSTPPFAEQNIELNEGDRQCVNATYRMLFAAATGVLPTQREVTESCIKVYHEPNLPIEEYLKTFHTQSFKEDADCKLTTCTIVGAGLDTLGELQEKIIRRNPSARVFAILALQTRTAPKSNVLHSSVLLRADSENVVMHDPRYNTFAGKEVGGESYIESRKEFGGRWAVGHNRADLVIMAKK